MTKQEKETNYAGIDLFKYMSSILVMIIHTTPLVAINSELNYAIVDGLCRLAVPFFFISSGFFLQKKVRKNPSYFNCYLKQLLKTYLWWSLIYLPIGLKWISTTFDLPVYLYPVALIVALIYVGTYYHLWYIPALIVAIYFVRWFLKHFGYGRLFALGTVLYGVGCLETYYGVIQNQVLQGLIKGYVDLFATTRNGVFFGIIFVTMGFFINDYEQPLRRLPVKSLLVVSSFLLILEVAFLAGRPGFFSNFLICLPVVSFPLFLMAKELRLSIDTRKLRNWSSDYYFSHLLFVVLYQVIMSRFGVSWQNSEFGLMTFFVTITGSHLFVLAKEAYGRNRATKVLEAQKLRTLRIQSYHLLQK